jgi:hypothetical protein
LPPKRVTSFGLRNWALQIILQKEREVYLNKHGIRRENLKSQAWPSCEGLAGQTLAKTTYINQGEISDVQDLVSRIWGLIAVIYVGTLGIETPNGVVMVVLP